jgi:hypothetical protein
MKDWIEQARDYRAQGLSYRAIGERVHYSTEWTRQILTEHSTKNLIGPSVLARDRAALHLREQGLSYRVIAERCGYTNRNHAECMVRRLRNRLAARQ